MGVHIARQVMVRMLNGTKLQPPQTSKPAGFPAWVQEQQSQA
jgi:hypothetical protein